jgi:hypothetical protein
VSLASQRPVVLPDAGPLITLAYADALDLLRKPGWPVQLVDMVLHEVTRNVTPTSAKIAAWADEHLIEVQATRTFAHYQTVLTNDLARLRKSNLGEIAVQEAMNALALAIPGVTGVFLFEDHKIARASFLLPDCCRKVSTRAWLRFLEGRGWIDCAADIERRALVNGRNFSRPRFPS